MLTTAQREEFEGNGIVRMPRAITKLATDEMLGAIWDCLRHRYHIHRDVPDTWPEPEARSARVDQIGGTHRFLGTRHLPRSVTFDQIGNAVTCAALDDLFGVGRWQRPERWGSLLVTFPEATRQWDVPSRNWHLDLPASHSSVGLIAVRVFTCLARLVPTMGGTLFVAGSHRLVQNQLGEGEHLSSSETRKRLIRAYPWVKALCASSETGNRIQRFMKEGTTIDGVEVRVVEMTGEPGDVILAHPMILHAPVLNCSSSPRFALSTTVFCTGITSVKLYP